MGPFCVEKEEKWMSEQLSLSQQFERKRSSERSGSDISSRNPLEQQEPRDPKADKDKHGGGPQGNPPTIHLDEGLCNWRHNESSHSTPRNGQSRGNSTPFLELQRRKKEKKGEANVSK